MIYKDKETNDNGTHTRTHACTRAHMHTHARTHTLAHIFAGISPATTCWRWFCPPLRLIPVFLNSPFSILTKQILSHYFYALQALNVVKMYSVRYGSSGSSQYCSERGGRVPLSLYIHWTRREGTIVAVLYFYFMTLHSTDVKVNFPGKHIRFLTLGVKVKFFYFCHYYYIVHFINFSMPNRPQKPPFAMSVSGTILFKNLK